MFANLYNLRLSWTLTKTSRDSEKKCSPTYGCLGLRQKTVRGCEKKGSNPRLLDTDGPSSQLLDSDKNDRSLDSVTKTAGCWTLSKTTEVWTLTKTAGCWTLTTTAGGCEKK